MFSNKLLFKLMYSGKRYTQISYIISISVRLRYHFLVKSNYFKHTFLFFIFLKIFNEGAYLTFKSIFHKALNLL